MAKKKIRFSLRNRQHRNTLIVISVVLIVTACIAVLFLSLKKDYNDTEGNSPSNISNTGLAAIEDGFIYYTKFDSGFKIFKYDISSRSEKYVCDGYAKYINVFKGYIYYIDGNVGTVNKVSTSGSDPQLLVDNMCSNLYVTRDHIYYINRELGNNIYRMGTEDLSTSLICDASVNNMIMDGVYIYYTDLTGNNSINRVNIQNGEKELLYDQQTTFFAVIGEYVYYTNISDESYVYYMDLDGTNKERLNGVKGWYLAAASGDDEYLYYKSNLGSISKVNLTTLNQTTVVFADCAYINIIGDYIFYLDQDDDNIYMTDLKGGDPVIIY
jgi:hypothetical protein